MQEILQKYLIFFLNILSTDRKSLFFYGFYDIVPVFRAVVERGFNAQQAVIFCDTLASARSSRFDKRRIDGNGDIGNGGVLCLSRAVREYKAVAVAF